MASFVSIIMFCSAETMKVLIVFCLAIASTCAFNLRTNKFVDMQPFVPVIESESRITNGQAAKDGQFPYQVGLNLRMNLLLAAWCGGSLISPTWIVTAAHCTDGIPTITAYLGSTTRQGGIAVTVVEKIIHSGWDSETLANDISLLRIPAVSMSININIIPMPSVSSSYSTYVNRVAVASGWGKTSDSGNVASDLQYADLTVVDNTVCSNVYGTTIVKPSNVCVATPMGTSTCNGDSGGPLVDKASGLLIGVTSFGAAAGCTKEYPAAFTRITSYRTWIKEYTGV